MASLQDPVRLPSARLLTLIALLALLAGGGWLWKKHERTAEASSAVATPAAVGTIVQSLPTKEDQAAFERALVKLGNMRWAETISYAQNAAETKIACRRIVPSTALLASVKAQCTPTIAAPKLIGLLPARCDTPSATKAGCLRLLKRISKTYTAWAKAKTDFQTAVNQFQGACGAALEAYPERGASLFTDVATDARGMRVGIQREDKNLIALSLQNFTTDVRALTIPSTAPQQRYIDGFRAACHLAHTKDPVAPSAAAAGQTPATA